MARAGKRRVLHFYNDSGSLDNAVKFLETIQKKVGYLNLTAEVGGGCKVIKVVLFGSRDLQQLAVETLKDFADQILQ